jgi:hypothetical protein
MLYPFLSKTFANPIAHGVQMHDETFYVTKGTVRFHAKDGARIDAKVGDVVSLHLKPCSQSL